ncbi:MAG: hypothetical protein JW864_04275 [Spirochaetes bacterium]|nr:hypothetical protein [Spirochaetota bacterium]
MKLKIITIIIILTNILFAEDTEDSKKIIGFWATLYTASGLEYGYVFDSDGFFYYLDESGNNVKYLYSGSMGKWKIENNKIMIRIEYNTKWEKEWIEDVQGFYYPGENNSCILIKDKLSNWESIGDIRIYTSSKSYTDKDDSYSKPANIFFRKILNKEIHRYHGSYWKRCEEVSNCDRAQSIIRFFKNTKKNK